MKHFKILVVGILVISLMINIRLLSKINDVEYQVNSLSNTQFNIMSSVDNQSSHIHRIMEDFKREQSWISSIQMEVGTVDLETGKTTLNFNWQIKELLQNSEVVFHSKRGEEQDFTSTPAVETENGLFEVSIPTEVQLKPELHTSISSDYMDGEIEVERAIEEKNEKEHNNNTLSYYVSVTNENLVKSSEIQSNYIGYLGASYYGVLETRVDMYNDSYNVSVMVPPIYNDSDISLQAAYLMKYKDGKLVEEERLISNEEIYEGNRPAKERYIHLEKESSDEKFEYTSLGLKVVYSNGASFEEKLYIQ